MCVSCDLPGLAFTPVYIDVSETMAPIASRKCAAQNRVELLAWRKQAQGHGELRLELSRPLLGRLGLSRSLSSFFSPSTDSSV